MLPSNKTNKEATILDTSVLAMFAGAMVSAVYPPYAIVGMLMSWCGVCGIGYFYTTWSKFDRLFKALNLGIGSSFPMLNSKEEKEVSVIYKFTLPAGLSLEDFDKSKLAIEQFLGREIDIKYTYKEIWIEVFEQNSREIYEYQTIHCMGNVSFPVGYDRRGELITCDLSSGEPHLLIAGETGSGKSTVLRSIITNIILDKRIKLHLIDLKRGAEFQIFAKCGNVVDFARTKQEAYGVLNDISAEVDRRYDLFYKNDCVDIKEYNRKIGKLGYEVVVIDEFADLHDDKKAITILEEISAKARACGIHLILSTQRPDSKILNGRVKANVTTILGLKTTNVTNSQIIIDKPGLEKLRGKGQGIFKRGNLEQQIQCPFLTTERARELLRPTYVDRPVTIIEQEADLL